MAMVRKADPRRSLVLAVWNMRLLGMAIGLAGGAWAGFCFWIESIVPQYTRHLDLSAGLIRFGIPGFGLSLIACSDFLARRHSWAPTASIILAALNLFGVVIVYVLALQAGAAGLFTGAFVVITLVLCWILAVILNLMSRLCQCSVLVARGNALNSHRGFEPVALASTAAANRGHSPFSDHPITPSSDRDSQIPPFPPADKQGK